MKKTLVNNGMTFGQESTNTSNQTIKMTVKPWSIEKQASNEIAKVLSSSSGKDLSKLAGCSLCTGCSCF